jgi:hypothetical protein
VVVTHSHIGRWQEWLLVVEPVRWHKRNRLDVQPVWILRCGCRLVGILADAIDLPKYTIGERYKDSNPIVKV